MKIAHLDLEPIAARFWPKVERRDETECWPWLAGLDKGYGKFRVHRSAMMSAYVVAYVLVFRVDVPEGFELDHVCHTNDIDCLGGDACPHRRCVNPYHLEVVTHAENSRRGRFVQLNRERMLARTHCKQGHPFDEANTRICRSGWRRCRKCEVIHSLGTQRRAREAKCA